MTRATHYDVAIIGAGPAGLFTAREIARNLSSTKIILIDKGRKSAQRECPLIKVGKCIRCNLCNAVFGIGGAGLYSDGKLSIYPAGSGLKYFFRNESEIKEINEYILSIFLDKLPIGSYKYTKPGPADFKDIAKFNADESIYSKSYDVYHLGTERIQQFLSELENELLKFGINILDQTVIFDIEVFGDIFVLSAKDVRGKTTKIYCDKLIIATGKGSAFFLRNIMNSLGVIYEFNHIDLGIRIETDRDVIRKLNDFHLDAKLKILLAGSDVEVRTFCLCDGGYLLSCFYDFDHYDRVCLISGLSFDSKKTNNSNFGVLVRKKFPENVDPIKTQINIIREINEASGTGTTLVQRYKEFMSDRATTNEAYNRNRIQSTLPEITPTNLRWFLPHYAIVSIEIFINKLNLSFPECINENTLLHAPVWENCFDRIKLNQDMSTSIPGLYIIGDASGFARGIVQAASMGVYIARKIINN